MSRYAMAMLLVAGACGGRDLSTVDCSTLSSQSDCQVAGPKCAWAPIAYGVADSTGAALAPCGGGGGGYCYDTTKPVPVVNYADATPPSTLCPDPCVNLDEASCNANPSCLPNYCLCAYATGGAGGGQGYDGGTAFDGGTGYDSGSGSSSGFTGCYSRYGAKDLPACAPCPPPPSSCTGLDQKSCAANPACEVVGCQNSTCSGLDFFGCYDKGTGPEISCPAIACTPDCHSLDQNSCSTTPGCTAGDCCGHFAGCYGPGDSAPICQCATCEQLNEAACKTDSKCYTIYHQGVFVSCSSTP